MTVRLKSAALVITLLVGIGVAAYATPSVRWRLDIVALKLTGQIDGVELSELVSMLKPRSGYWLKPLAESRNPYSSIFNPFDSPTDQSAGEKLFINHCSVCHGSNGNGDSASSLTRAIFTHGDADWALYKNIRDGIAGTAMPQTNLDDRSIWSVVAYVNSLKQASSITDTSVVIDAPAVLGTTLAEATESPDDWLTYSGAYNSQRYSKLDQISRDNASQAQVRWIYQFSGTYGIQEASPIVVSGIMYLTEAPNTVHALNASTGKHLWSYTHRNKPDLKLCCGSVNRGLAILGDTLYMGTLDSHVVALNATNGEVKWMTQHHDHRLGSSITAAPLVVGNKVIVGYGGGDMGTRGFLDAIDATTGSLLWRTFTIPSEGEPGNNTWSGDSWKTGGAATWLTGSYDSRSRLLYWTTGNPAPDYQGEQRLGDNLYSCSVLALNIDTGQVVWHFQFTPHDERDWDSNQIPVLVDREWNGEQRRLLLLANRNAFFYVLDRDSGEFLSAKPFAKQNWATNIDAKGRPVLNMETKPSTEGTVTWPSPNGATNWQSPTYSPSTGLFYVPTLEYGQIIFKDVEPASYRPGEYFLGGGGLPIPGAPELFFSVRAIDPNGGDIIWEYDSPPRDTWWKTGGLVSTGGDIIFGGDGTHLFILDAFSGAQLWKQNVGGRINASPITYQAAGKQYFAIAAGRSILAVGIGDQQALEQQAM